MPAGSFQEKRRVEGEGGRERKCCSEVSVPSGEIVGRLRSVVRAVLVEVGGVDGGAYGGYDGGSDGFGAESLEVESVEPAMLADVLHPSASAAESLVGRLATELLDEDDGVLGHLAGELEGVDALEDEVVGAHGIGGGEGAECR